MSPSSNRATPDSPYDSNSNDTCLRLLAHVNGENDPDDKDGDGSMDGLCIDGPEYHDEPDDKDDAPAQDDADLDQAEAESGQTLYPKGRRKSH